MVQWLGLCTFTAEGMGSISGQGAKTPQATRPKQQQKQKKTKPCINLRQGKTGVREDHWGAIITICVSVAECLSQGSGPGRGKQRLGGREVESVHSQHCSEIECGVWTMQ